MQNCELLARRLYRELFAATGGRPRQWVTLQTLADRLDARDGALEAAVELGVDLGWLEAEGMPAQCVCLGDKGRGERV